MSKKLAQAIAPYAYRDEPEEVTVADLLGYYPMRWEDRSNLMGIEDIGSDQCGSVELYARVAGGYRVGRKRPGKAPPLYIFEVTAGDRRLRFKPVVVWWFLSGRGAPGIIEYWKNKFTHGTRFVVYGDWEWDARKNTYALRLKKPDEIEFLSDEFEEEDELEEASGSETDTTVHVSRIVPVYRKLGDFQSKRLREIVFGVLEALKVSQVPETLPDIVTKRNDLIDRFTALNDIHFPPEGSSLVDYAAAETPAHKRLIFEEFFTQAFMLRYLRAEESERGAGPALKATPDVKTQIAQLLPFTLTAAQRKVVIEIFKDIGSTHPMNRLIQGDVGSGKTIVALIAAFVSIKNGYQAALMAPTEILAEQHYASAINLFKASGISIELLTGRLKAAEKRRVQKEIAEGSVDLVVGTHALIQDAVEFKKLGLAVIDEQHRFGVGQRAKLREIETNPHILVMTATPIPRSLAMTVYGDLDVSVIDELPPGRTPVKTVVVGEDRRSGVYKGIRREIESGRQVYIVYPLVEESERMDLKAATAMHEDLSRNVFPELNVGLIHGKMKSADKESVMAAFQSGEIKILVSTTVIEVGMDVPNASLMIVEHAERFGLSQLHQLRGRVGRGAAESYCVLLSGDKQTKVAKERLGIMEETNDGFLIAEKDLELRGQGDIIGTKQSGTIVFRLGHIFRDLELLKMARAEAIRLIGRKGSSESRLLAERIQADSRARFYGVG
ncbi:MAG: ATP-dependent DNA helicase RecG [Pyrinomonadaceae bacterium]